MAEDKQGYRAFPKYIASPSKAKTISADEFNKIAKIKMQEVGSAHSSHKKTIVWFSESLRSYVLEIQFDSKPTIYILSLCTFTPNPKIGMDMVDGEFAQDAEDYILSKELNFVSPRMKIFDATDQEEIGEYFKSRKLFQK